MATSEDVPPSGWEAKDANALGPALLRCRRLSIKSTMANNGSDVFVAYVTPFVAGFVGALGVLLLLAMFGGGGTDGRAGPPPYPWNRIVEVSLLGSFAIGTAAGFWAFFGRPGRATLTLHEGGFRHKRDVFDFDDLARLRRGRPLTEGQQYFADAIAEGKRPITEVLMGSRGRAIREDAEVRIARARASLQVEFADGQVAYLNNFLASYEPEDLSAFFGTIRELHPHLLG